MSTLTRIAGVSLCIALHFLWSAPARAFSSESDPTTTAPAPADPKTADADSTAADSAAAAPIDTIDHFIPISTSRVESNDVSIAIGSKLNVRIDAGRGWKFIHDLGMERRQYRQRDMEDLSENVLNRVDKIHPGLYKLGAQVGESYSKRPTLGAGRFGKDIIYDNTSANLEFSVLKRLLGASASDLTITGAGSKGPNDFKYNRTYSGSANGMLRYMIGDLLTVVGGAGASVRRETSNVGGIRFGPMPSNTDSVEAGLSYGRGKAKTIEVSYNWLKGVERWVAPPLGNSNEVLADMSRAYQEETRNRTEQLSVKTSLQPFSFLAVSTDFAHSTAVQKYQVDTRQSTESETNSIRAAAYYSYAPRGNLEFGISTRDDLSDFGPVSLRSCREREHTLSLGIRQKLGDSISVSMSGSGSLLQRFYLKQDVNPRDTDILFYRGDFSLSAPYRKFSVNVNGTLKRFETINIDSTLSGDNRIDYDYELGPSLSLKPATWLSLTQDYIIKIQFTDFVFTEGKNYLNRTTTLNTRAYFKAFRSLTFAFLHSYLMKDSGSYLMRTGGRRYSPGNETFEHALNLKAGYQVIADFDVKAESNFRIQRGNVFGTRNGRKIIAATTLYESGGTRVGFERKIKLGEHGGISLDVAYVRNYGPYITPERKKYWEADSELTLAF